MFRLAEPSLAPLQLMLVEVTVATGEGCTSITTGNCDAPTGVPSSVAMIMRLLSPRLEACATTCTVKLAVLPGNEVTVTPLMVVEVETVVICPCSGEEHTFDQERIAGADAQRITCLCRVQDRGTLLPLCARLNTKDWLSSASIPSLLP